MIQAMGAETAYASDDLGIVATLPIATRGREGPVGFLDGPPAAS